MILKTFCANLFENIRRHWLIYAMLIAITLVVYWQVGGFEFVNFDDDCYVYNQPIVMVGLTPSAIQWAFATTDEANWHPLTWISLMADAETAKWILWIFDMELGKQNSGVYHLTNLLLHILNTLLLFAMLRRATGFAWRSAFVAALFAVHPLHVESVAWVAERKDVLSTMFWMLTMLAYVSYAEKPNTRRYLLVVLAFVLGLMAKPMLVSLPLVLLLMDIWPLRRLTLTQKHEKQKNKPAMLTWRDLVLEKVPLFVISAISCGITIYAQMSGDAVAGVDLYPMGARVANATVAAITYIIKMIWPVRLTSLYIHPGTSLPVWQTMVCTLALIAITFIAVRAARKRPYITAGWFWYLITLVPVIGLVQVGKQAMADRYTYVPLIGLFIIIAWGIPDLLGLGMAPGKKPSRAVAALLAVLAALAVLPLMAVAHTQVGYWQNSITLFSHDVEVNPGNSLAHNNIANILVDSGKVDMAIGHYHKALKYHPEYTDARYNFAIALSVQGNVREAERQYRRVLRESPGFAEAHNNYGTLLAKLGRLDEAIDQFREALEIEPTLESAQKNLQKALYNKGVER